MPEKGQGPYFIHLQDPGFPAAPWPGVRRLGPFNTVEEALDQAVADAAAGMGVALGIYDEEGSLTHDEVARVGADGGALPRPKKATSIHTSSEIRRKGDEERRRREKTSQHETLSQERRDEALQNFLKDTVTVGELRSAGLLR